MAINVKIPYNVKNYYTFIKGVKRSSLNIYLLQKVTELNVTNKGPPIVFPIRPPIFEQTEPHLIIDKNHKNK